MMRTFLDDMIEESLAKGMAKGKAEGMAVGKVEGKLESILHMVSKGRATIDGARAEIEELLAAGGVTRAQADAALAKLG